MLLLFVVITTCVLGFDTKHLLAGNLNESGDIVWSKWSKKYSKQYRSTSETLHRKAIFMINLKEIRDKNSKRTLPSDAWFDVNKWSDLTEDEFELKMLSKPMDDIFSSKSVVKNVTIPYPTGPTPKQYSACGQSYLFDDYDPNAIDLCGSIAFDQEDCGSCYCAGNAHNLQMKYANLTYLRDGTPTYEMMSVQQLMDCQEDSKHCYGGFSEPPLDSSHYIVTEEDYPYLSAFDTQTIHSCVKNKTTPIKVSYTLFDNAQSMSILKPILHYYGSFVAAVKAKNIWRSYSGGVLRNLGCSDDVVTNHIVTAVGYGIEDGEEFIILRNSWGSDWGINGFIKLGADSLCGIGGTYRGVRATSLVQHVDFSDKEFGDYGEYSEIQDVVPVLYDPTKDPLVNGESDEESTNDTEDIDTDTKTYSMFNIIKYSVFGALCFVVVVNLIVFINLCK
ncbi:Cathepsin Q [Entamoeba marina]